MADDLAALVRATIVVCGEEPTLDARRAALRRVVEWAQAGDAVAGVCVPSAGVAGAVSTLRGTGVSVMGRTASPTMKPTVMAIESVAMVKDGASAVVFEPDPAVLLGGDEGAAIAACREVVSGCRAVSPGCAVTLAVRSGLDAAGLDAAAIATVVGMARSCGCEAVRLAGVAGGVAQMRLELACDPATADRGAALLDSGAGRLVVPLAAVARWFGGAGVSA